MGRRDADYIHNIGPDIFAYAIHLSESLSWCNGFFLSFDQLEKGGDGERRRNRHSKIKGKMKGDKCGHGDGEIEEEIDGDRGEGRRDKQESVKDRQDRGGRTKGEMGRRTKRQ